MAAGPGLGPPGPRVLSVHGDRLPEEEPSRPQCAASLTAGAQRDAEEEEVTPPPRAQEVLSAPGQPGPGDMRPWGASGAGSMMGFHGNTTQRMPGPLAQHELSPCSGSGPEPGLTSIPMTTTTKQPRLLLPLAQAPALCSSQHFADPLSSLQTLWIPESHPPLPLLRALAYSVPCWNSPRDLTGNNL